MSFIKNLSEISGNGIFSKKIIKKGTTICFLDGIKCNTDEMITKVINGEEEASDPLQIGNNEYLDLDEISRTFNHSCSPNAFIKGKNQLIALRDIEKNEEITYDYSCTIDDDIYKIEKYGLSLRKCECNCKSPNCRKIIDQFTTLPQETKNNYIKNKILPDFILNKFKDTFSNS